MLHVHRSHRADALVRELAALLADPPADPFARELVAVPTRGMERWLTQQLSGRLGARPDRRDGVCAALDFPAPGRLLLEVLAAGSGVEPDRDPWSAERLVWPLIEVTDDLAEEPWLAALTSHLAAGAGRRYLRLRHLAGLFEHYALHRPGMILDWAAGGGPGWQPELWRRLRDRLEVPSPPERLAVARERLRAQPDLVELPARMSFFGLTRLAATHLELLATLAHAREVHLMLLHPSPALWRALAASGASAPLRRAEDTSGELVHHRLLASWGRDARELQLVIAGAGARDGDGGVVAAGKLGTAEPGDGPETLLERIQADIRADRSPPGAPLMPDAADTRIVVPADDASIRIHACHGRARQVAVLREAIMHRLAADATLEPRDIIVMCPDVEEFAPLIQAAFGSAGTADGELHVRLADRSLRQTNPLLGLAARLLELASARLTASEVLDLLDAPVVRRRFGFGDDEVSRLRRWVVDARIHWGLDAPHRRAWKLEGVAAGTWARGLTRLLLGVAVCGGGTERFGHTLAAAEIDSSDITLVGALAELVDRLDVAVQGLGGPHTLAGWVAALSDAVDLLGVAAPDEGWQRQELAGLLEDVLADGGGRAGIRLNQAEARALLTDRLRGRPTRANFRTGHLTVCTLHPMRSIPHRVVCLLGLDDRAFPRAAVRDGDDVLSQDPWVGDRDGRAEDRQLLLDALMAAEEALLITYSGNDERTNAPLPPAVPVGELLDAIDATARVPSEGEPAPASAAVLVRHPLQAFDPRNFRAGELGVPGPWSFDTVALAGARALSAGAGAGAGPEPPGPLTRPLPPARADALVALTDLIAFLERPARAFLRQRLGVAVTRWDEEIEDGLPVGFGGLERYGVGQRLLEAVLAGADWTAAVEAELARGTLPPGELGRPIMSAVYRTAREVAEQALTVAAAEPRTFETNLTLPSGRRLTGTVSGVRDRVLLGVAFSRLNPRQRLAAWVRLLALSAAHPEVPWEAVTIGRAGVRGATVAVARIPPLAGTAEGRAMFARDELERLLELRDEGLSEPLLAPSRTAEAHVRALAEGEDPAAAARTEWVSGWGRSEFIEREDAEPEHRLLYGADLDIERLARDAARIWAGLRPRERMEWS
ncbi:MAG TPA: exodeoxyribonuclease V subunit gamma [Solirubrobacteraceae bacterium]|nr:exodeoxyribonuclease V subunit gamma [Solirubrobacteraceae bacterium]